MSRAIHGIPIPDFWDPSLQQLAADALDRLAREGMLDSILPARENVFRAFAHGNPVCCIIGQDPYPSIEDASGLAFSSPAQKLPASLRNIYKEMIADLGTAPHSGDLSHWVEQGVLLANVGLTLGADGKTHLPYWADFAGAWIASLAAHRSIVWILWGRHAQAWRPLIESSSKPQIVLESAHPSPLSARRGFFGSRPFSKANAGLRELGLPEINWAGLPFLSGAEA